MEPFYGLDPLLFVLYAALAFLLLTVAMFFARGGRLSLLRGQPGRRRRR